IFSHPRQETGKESVLSGLTAFWGGGMDQEQGLKLFNDMGLDNPEETVRMVNQFRDSHAVLALSSHGRERLDRLVPLLLSEVGNSTQTALTVQRLLHIIESIQRRTCYLAMLEENPGILSRLTSLCSESSWIAKLLARHPILLDELIGARPLDATPDREELTNELRMRMDRISPDDLEQQMDELRAFKLARTLRVAVADLADSLPLMKVSDHLTEIAEIVLSKVLDLAWAHLGERHGWPGCTISGTGCDKGFAVAAYGKLGGIELGYGSDLDLVFLHAGDSGDMTDGKKPVFNPHFFIRMGQRIIHILTTNTMSGVLYPVDMRLRPSGESGVLVSHVDGFAEYQSTDARIWEHQSLIRARIVAGDPLVGRRFDEIRKEILTRFHDPDTLRNEVRSMRERMS
ncbi:MAG: bifunctional [glutamate--ammonia ligase]-adenylyl-L-tyrosine phosphorylase/[glutamate--ammonia-ligase] adenylyltransferase, partial [Desulfobulbaceae bacterium]|nr:bifunctional [glutamate--ammonia ligase]-adenylyl-L-tyrosine phosphorylase/[glutamate--ammonia-ligase] adenylyltransferase [Desulfobulbaceae bacterium]